MKLIRASKDLKIGGDTIKKGCVGVVNGHVTFHAALTVTSNPIGPIFDLSAIPDEGFERVMVPDGDTLAQKTADRLHWSMDPADPFTNEVSALMKEVIRGKKTATEQLLQRLTEML